MNLALPRMLIVDDLATKIITFLIENGPFGINWTPINSPEFTLHYEALAEIDGVPGDDQYRTIITKEALRRFGLALAWS